MNRVHFEPTSPRMALACAAAFTSFTTLGVLVLLPSLDRDGNVRATMTVQCGSPAPAESRAAATGVEHSITAIQSMEKRS